MKVPYVDLPAQNRVLKKEILEAVEAVIEHGNFILGKEVGDLEQHLASYLGVSEVVGVNSGLDALVLALRLHGVGHGDEVITVSHSFVATASAIVLAGARPVFADVREDTYLMDPRQLERVVTSRTRAIIPAHLCGCSVDLEPIREFCRTAGLVLVEDCAQAIGAEYGGRKVGSFGIGCFSFHPLKILSALGDGGFLAVNDTEQASRLRRLRNHGLKDRDHCVEVSGNTRLDTLQAAILMVKMKRLEGWIARRRALAARYTAALSPFVHVPVEPKDCRHVYSSYVISTPEREMLRTYLEGCGVEVKVHYPLPIHLQEPYVRMAGGREVLPVTEALVDRILSLPVYPELSEESQDYVIEKMIEFFEHRKQL